MLWAASGVLPAPTSILPRREPIAHAHEVSSGRSEPAIDHAERPEPAQVMVQTHRFNATDDLAKVTDRQGLANPSKRFDDRHLDGVQEVDEKGSPPCIIELYAAVLHFRRA